MSGGFWNVEDVQNSCDLWIEVDDKFWSPLIPTREAENGNRQMLNAVTVALIFMLPAVEIDQIAEGNVDDVFVRVRMFETATGGMLMGGNEARMVSLLDVRRHIGLRVGAGMVVSPFANRLVGSLRKLATDALRSEKEAI